MTMNDLPILRHAWCVCLALAVGATGIASAQPEASAAGPPEGLPERVRVLEEQQAELLGIIQELHGKIDELKRTREAEGVDDEEVDIEELLDPEPIKSTQTSGASRAVQNLNPNISLTADFVASASSLAPAGIAPDARYTEAQVNNRSICLGFQHPVSPYGDATAFLGAHGGGVEVEEAYLDLNRISSTTSFRLGRSRLPFGLFNRKHEHELQRGARRRYGLRRSRPGLRASRPRECLLGPGRARGHHGQPVGREWPEC